jgi:hypothetical protein
MTTGLPFRPAKDILVPSKLVRVKSGAGRFTMVMPLRPVMGSLCSILHPNSHTKAMHINPAIIKADLRKNILSSINFVNP